tara:strand:+ start:46 stop:597 length:552 start_codon:yes stop_codon:yes gene_type:complete
MEIEDKKLRDKEGTESLANKMQEIEIEKMVFNCGGTDDKLKKSIKLLEQITGKKVHINKSTRRIPAFNISPGKESGCKVTLRNKEQINELLSRFFAAESNEIPKKQIVENQFSLGIAEYIEVPGLEYDRDIGILGFEVTIVFKRKGKRVKIRKIKKGKYPKKQSITKEEIIEYLNKNFGVEIK